ncbi:MAG: transketolase [Deltaproteobacteria bacterium]|nr:transketolase [Deltaproteobacteria bacterium]
MDNITIQELEKHAKEIRRLTIRAFGSLGEGHVGGALSIVEILTILYYRYMRIDPQDPKKENRDRLVLSKGHAGPALYATLALRGYFPVDWMETLNRGGTRLPSHCDMNLTPGIDMTTGSLGQGISAAIGLALGNRLNGIERTVYLIIGDGESDEGQIWEGAMAAAHYSLSNLIAFTDFNKMQIGGYTDEIMSLGDLDAKWKAFGWFTQHVNGHSFEELAQAIEAAQEERERPSMIILDTIKGKGASYAEGDVTNHYMPVSQKQTKEALEKLELSN